MIEDGLLVEAEQGDVIIRHGEISDAAYFIVDGRAIAGRKEGNQETVLEVLNAGDFFGEIAAAFHDIGFTEHYGNHEIAGARIAAQVLSDYGFTACDIEAIIGMIIATRLPQSPRNLLEEIIADADLDVLGRTDFWSRNEALRQELANMGQKIALKQWYEGQAAFLKSHNYFTPAARMLRDEMKKQHISMLDDLLRTME